jgi:hypothetical protein
VLADQTQTPGVCLQTANCNTGTALVLNSETPSDTATPEIRSDYSAASSGLVGDRRYQRGTVAFEQFPDRSGPVLLRNRGCNRDQRAGQHDRLGSQSAATTSY